METCFKILQLKFDQKLTNRCIGLTMKISASTVFEVLARFKATSLPWPLPEAISHDGLEKLIFPAKGIPASERETGDGVLPLLPMLPGVEKDTAPLNAPGAPCR